jgi:hypothetical protein
VLLDATAMGDDAARICRDINAAAGSHEAASLPLAGSAAHIARRHPQPSRITPEAERVQSRSPTGRYGEQMREIGSAAPLLVVVAESLYVARDLSGYLASAAARRTRLQPQSARDGFQITGPTRSSSYRRSHSMVVVAGAWLRDPDNAMAPTTLMTYL